MLQTEWDGFAREYDLQKHCEYPKSSCTAANAHKLVDYQFHKMVEVEFIQRDPQKD